MELQSLLFFHFIHNFQFRPVVQVCVCWRAYSGDYYKIFCYHIIILQFII